MSINTLNVLFLWHLHQPLYKMADSQQYILPWVRLHSIKAYLDMAYMSEQYPEMGMTFNLTPSLMLQLEDYTGGNADDYYEKLSRTKPEDLDPTERNFIIDNFFQANWATMIHPYPGYKRLLNLKENKNYAHFTNQDILDLQVWFNLSWFGFAARKKYPQINELLHKDHNFSGEDKENILKLQYTILDEILPYYKKISSGDIVELSTTPMYHPILPLVYNSEIARRCMPHSPLPNKFSYPEDAEKHITMAMELYFRHFNRKPSGFWPAEGSVSPEIAKLFQEKKISWIASDEEVLFNSMLAEGNYSLFRPYSIGDSDDKLHLFFRDKGISDAIGFRYSKMNADQAIDDLFQNLSAISQSNDNKHIAIILDGENPWEYYFDGGEKFLSKLYSKLSESKHLIPMSMKKAVEETDRSQQITQLYSASWIYGNFQIWIGSEEDNRAWEYLLETRKTINEHKKQGKEADKISKALEYIYVAEGSDWFWWYGDDFQSMTKKDFDTLFRSYLIAAWEALDLEVPSWLLNPLIQQKQLFLPQPEEFISPIIDGESTHYFEWQGSIIFATDKAGSAMFNSQNSIKEIAYGINEENFFIRVKFQFQRTEKQRKLQLKFYRSHAEHAKNSQVNDQVNNRIDKSYICSIPLHLEPGDLFPIFQANGNQSNSPTGNIEAAYKEFFECKIAYHDLEASPGDEIQFNLELLEEDIAMEVQPVAGLIRLTVPGLDYFKEHWFI